MLSIAELRVLARQLDDRSLARQLGPFALIQRPWVKATAVIPRVTQPLALRRLDALASFDDLRVATLPPLGEMDSMLVGRAVDSDVLIDEETVSKRHARIDWLGDHAELEDLASSNGTFINGQRLPANERLPIKDDDGLAFGGVQMLFVHAASLRRFLLR